jgi:hypothetical protein
MVRRAIGAGKVSPRPAPRTVLRPRADDRLPRGEADLRTRQGHPQPVATSSGGAPIEVDHREPANAQRGRARSRKAVRNAIDTYLRLGRPGRKLFNTRGWTCAMGAGFCRKTAGGNDVPSYRGHDGRGAQHRGGGKRAEGRPFAVVPRPRPRRRARTTHLETDPRRRWATLGTLCLSFAKGPCKKRGVPEATSMVAAPQGRSYLAQFVARSRLRAATAGEGTFGHVRTLQTSWGFDPPPLASRNFVENNLAAGLRRRFPPNGSSCIWALPKAFALPPFNAPEGPLQSGSRRSVEPVRGRPAPKGCFSYGGLAVRDLQRGREDWAARPGAGAQGAGSLREGCSLPEIRPAWAGRFDEFSGGTGAFLPRLPIASADRPPRDAAQGLSEQDGAAGRQFGSVCEPLVPQRRFTGRKLASSSSWTDAPSDVRAGDAIAEKAFSWLRTSSDRIFLGPGTPRRGDPHSRVKPPGPVFHSSMGPLSPKEKARRVAAM